MDRKSAPDIKDISLFNDFISACFTTNQPTVLKAMKKIFTDKQALRLCHDLKLTNLNKLSQIDQPTWYKLFDFYQKNKSIIPTKVTGSFSLQYNNQSQLKKYHDTYTL
jgi:16S rRNA A1518/A1519 N6-dimethyltransferase RsmA/KsgA/DIM1 with predicted DNA glycosylase/AP lyase activity